MNSPRTREVWEILQKCIVSCYNRAEKHLTHTDKYIRHKFEINI